MSKTQDLYAAARKLIPGGTQLFSKRPELHLPGYWPAYYERAKGCEVWDLDGRRYVDASYMGIGACVLGYADEDVNAAVQQAIDRGTMTTLNCPEEVALAEVLCDIHPWAQMARFTRSGGEAMAVAVRIARARTGKDRVLFCGYHGWHDWYLAANLADDSSLDGHLLPGLAPAGVARGLAGTAIPFKYNDLKAFRELLGKHRADLAAVVVESIRSDFPEEGFLETIRDQTAKAGIILIIDEISAGWRLNPGGAHLNLNVMPDIAIFGKGMSNGFPMAAVIGTSDAMDAAQDAFISSTYWTERTGPAAALATIAKFKKHEVSKHLMQVGKDVQAGWTESAKKHDLKVSVGGIYPLSHYSFEYDKPLVLKTLFTQLMLEKGFLATTAFYAAYAHKAEHVTGYLAVVDEAFGEIAAAIKDGRPERRLKGPVCHGGFERLT